MKSIRKEYRKVAKLCKYSYRKLISACDHYQTFSLLSEKAIDDLIDERVKQALMNVPVEALNFNSARIRTSALKSAGYNSVGQIVGKSSFMLRNIYGIGQASIERIKNNASIIYKHCKEKIVIKINVRSRSDKNRNAIINAALYDFATQRKQQCLDLIKKYQTQYSYPIKRVLKCTNSFVWILSSKAGKTAKLNLVKDAVDEKCEPFLIEVKPLLKIWHSDNEMYDMYKDKLDVLNKCTCNKWPCLKFVDETVERMITPSNCKSGYNVTGICKVTNQPRGGFVNINFFKKETYQDGNLLLEEQISPGIIGTAVDYLTRVQLGCDEIEKAFEISLLGARMMKDDKLAQNLLDGIKDLSDESIRCAALLVGYDATYRAGYPYHVDVNYRIDSGSINNIRILVNRSVEFFKKNGSRIESGLTFVGGYTDKVSSGDADYMIDDTIWDLKTSRSLPDKNQTLQILIYYLLAKHSGQEKYKCLKNIGIYNPRLNISYKINVDDIDKSIIETVEKEVIGY